ncbi:MAG: LLM class flavin-dependent oxidoreductase [Myxococcota bacterium]
MKRALFTTLDTHPSVQTSVAARYDAFVRHVTVADALGFDAFWVGEHHGTNVGRIPNPAVLLAAAAAKTRRIRLGPAVSVLPLRPPRLVAEDYAMLDALSGGRLDMGVGVGSQRVEFEHLGVDFDQRRALFDAHLDELERAWETDSGPDKPPLYVATLSEEGAFRVGKAGRSMLTLVSPAVRDLDEIERRLRAHARGLEEHGGAANADAVVMVFACAAANEREARLRASRSLGNFIELSSGTRPDDPVALCDAMRQRGTGLFASREQMTARVDALVRRGFENLCFFVDFGTMEANAVEETMRSLAPSCL